MLSLLRCAQCGRSIAARWTRCPFCKRPSYAPRHRRYPFIDRQLEGFRVFAIGGSLWWLGLSVFIAFATSQPGWAVLPGSVGLIAFVTSLAVPLSSLAWRVTELAWASACALLVGLLAVTGWPLLTALVPLAVVVWMRRLRRDAVARLEGREPPEVKDDESHVPKWSPCEVCGSRDSSVVAPLYVMSFITVSFRWPGAWKALCPQHAKQNALPALLVSALLGPVGLPWGFMWALEAVQLNWDQGGVHLDSQVLGQMRALEAEGSSADDANHGFELLGGLVATGIILFATAWRVGVLLGG